MQLAPVTAGVPVITVTGWSNSGKTTFFTKVVELLTAAGYNVGVIKHHGHKAETVDQKGKDSWKYAQAGANPPAFTPTKRLPRRAHGAGVGVSSPPSSPPQPLAMTRKPTKHNERSTARNRWRDNQPAPPDENTSRHRFPAALQVAFTASVFGGAGGREKEMLRKKCHVVRKKYHVVRKIFYVASIFGRPPGRENRPPVGTFSLSQMSSAKAERI